MIWQSRNEIGDVSIKRICHYKNQAAMSLVCTEMNKYFLSFVDLGKVARCSIRSDEYDNMCYENCRMDFSHLFGHTVDVGVVPRNLYVLNAPRDDSIVGDA